MKVCSVCLQCYEDQALSCIEENHDSLTEARPGGCEIIVGYRLKSLIQIDEISETYRTINLTSNQLCVIKIINSNLVGNDEELQSQFLKESQSISQIDHPNLARVFESGLLPDGSFYTISEALTGQTLSAYLSSCGALSEITAVNIARQIAEGLEAIHAVGAVHRNLNPESIFLTTAAENEQIVKIQNIDSGSAKQQFVITGNFDSESVLNDLKYFSPEQCAGEKHLDFLTDIYSLGIVLYEMLAGRSPFDAPDAASIIYKQLHQTAPPIQITKFNIRALLTHTLTLSLQKVKTSRLKSASTFARQLRNIEQLTLNLLPLTPAARLGSKKTTAQAGRQINQTPPRSDLSKLEAPAIVIPSIEKEPLVVAITKDKLNDPVNFIDFAEPEKLSALPIAKPVLVEWEQPEDIPSEWEASLILGEKSRETALPFEPLPVSEEINVTQEPKLRTEFVEEIKKSPAKSVPLHARNSENIWQRVYVPNRRAFISTGAALLLLILVGAFLSWRLPSSDKRQISVAPSSSTARSITKDKESEAPEVTISSAGKSVESTVNDEAVMAMPDLPDSKTFVVRDDRPAVIPEKPQPLVKKQISQNSASKDSAINKTNTKREAVAPKEKSSNKTPSLQNAFPDIKIIIGKPSPNSAKPGQAKIDAFSRQRIVQKSKP